MNPGIPPSSPVSEKPLEPVNYSGSTPDIVDSATASINQKNLLPLRRRSNDSFGSARAEEDSLEMERDARATSYGRQSPEGKDHLAIVPREGKGNIDQYSADSNNNNGKINVQVTVLFGEWRRFGFLAPRYRSLAGSDARRLLLGTLADLKKHRAQSRFSQGSITGNGSLTPSEVIATGNGGGSLVAATEVDGNGKIPIELSLISADEHFQAAAAQQDSNGGSVSDATMTTTGGGGTVALGNGSTKFSGIITGDVVSDSTRSKRCCVVM